MASNQVQKLKMVMATQQIEAKTFSIKDAFKSTTKAAKEFQTDKGLKLPIIGIAAKFVPKYGKFHTMFYLENGMTTGCFSDAVFNFANLIFTATGISIADYARVDFDKPIIVEVIEKAFEHVDEVTSEKSAHTTYELYVVDGEAQNVRKIDSVSNYANLLGANDQFESLGLPAHDAIPSTGAIKE